MLVLGLDPGRSGGIAWHVLGGERTATGAVKFPETETDLRQILEGLMREHADWRAYVERVGATPQMGVTSAFTFGRGYGFLRGLLVGLGVPFEEVLPSHWQAEFGLRQKGRKLAQADTEKHNAIKGKAQQFYPHLKITHHTAAALLIAEWGCRQLRMRESA
jgi:hypothetical protein